jgi:hypothetical protein
MPNQKKHSPRTPPRGFIGAALQPVTTQSDHKRTRSNSRVSRRVNRLRSYVQKQRRKARKANARKARKNPERVNARMNAGVKPEILAYVKENAR